MKIESTVITLLRFHILQVIFYVVTSCIYNRLLNHNKRHIAYLLVTRFHFRQITGRCHIGLVYFRTWGGRLRQSLYLHVRCECIILSALLQFYWGDVCVCFMNQNMWWRIFHHTYFDQVLYLKILCSGRKPTTCLSRSKYSNLS